MTVWKNKKPAAPRAKKVYFFEAYMERMGGHYEWTRSIPFAHRNGCEAEMLAWKVRYQCEVRLVEEARNERR